LNYAMSFYSSRTLALCRQRSWRVENRSLSSRAAGVLSALNFPTNEAEIPGLYDGQWGGTGDILESRCPATGEVLARVRSASPSETRNAIAKAREAFQSLRNVPAPKRGEVIRQMREAIARKREALGALISLEMGKIATEGVGEVQEIIDIFDYAIGLSRMMNGRVVNSEREGHTILEVPNPLGVVGILSAFNFPVAVYGWNLGLSLAAGNATIWKPSPTTPLCAIAVTSILSEVLKKNGYDGAIAGLTCGNQSVGEELVGNKSVDMVSFTGSERVGGIVGSQVQQRFGKVLLELGGNNAAIVMPDADMKMAVSAVAFGAVGTAGQRCTSTRRLYLHSSIAPQFISSLKQFYSSPALAPGDPLHPKTLLGPLHTNGAVKMYNDAIKELTDLDAELVIGGTFYRAEEISSEPLKGGNFVRPTIVVPSPSASLREQNARIWATETFAPILKVATFDTIEEAIVLNNSVPQGLSSSLWTRDMRNVGLWTGPNGSDCGIVNVNAGTSGAEIGAAFGGNKSTGWGRESGGDAWKQYVRWSACTINYSNAMPLAQGVDFRV